jgi:hypothetical protein
LLTANSALHICLQPPQLCEALAILLAKDEKLPITNPSAYQYLANGEFTAQLKDCNKFGNVP